MSSTIAVLPDLSGPSVEAPRQARKISKFEREWTPSRRACVEQYIRDAQNEMGLRDWVISVDWSKSAKRDDAIATCTPMGDSRVATLRFSRKFLRQTPYMQRWVVVHELMHCHLFALADCATRSVEALGSKKEAAIFDASFDGHVESVVDAVAKSWAEKLPPLVLPDLPAEAVS